MLTARYTSGLWRVDLSAKQRASAHGAHFLTLIFHKVMLQRISGMVESFVTNLLLSVPVWH